MKLSKLVNKNTKLINYLFILICLLVSFIIPSYKVFAVSYTPQESESLIKWMMEQH